MRVLGKLRAACCLGAVPVCIFATHEARAQGLVGEWAFEEGRGGLVADTSGTGNKGTLQGEPKWVKDGIGAALELDGVDDYVDCGAAESLEIKKQITLEAWVYPIEASSGVGEPLVLGKGLYSYGLAYNPGAIWFYISDGAWHCVADIPTRKWTHVVGTYDGNKMRLYINGEFRTGYAMPEPNTRIKDPRSQVNPQNKVFIGKRGDAYFHGMVDNVRIYNRPLSVEEVKAHYLEEQKLVKQPPRPRRETLKGLALKVFDAGEDAKAIVIAGSETVESDLTVPSNVLLRFEMGGVCEVSKGATLSINGPFEAPRTRIFSGRGKVVFARGGVERVYPQWWGAKADDNVDDTAAIQAAIDSRPTGGMVFFPTGRYEISSRLTLISGCILQGALGKAMFHAARALPAMLQRPDLTPPPDGIHFNATTRVDGVRLANLDFNGEGSRIGLDLTNVNYVWLENVSVTNCKTGIMMAQLGMYDTFINPVIARCDIGIEINIGVMNNNFFGGRISMVKTGILINNTGHLNIYGMTFDAFKETGLDIRTGDQVNLHYAWFDSVAPAVPVKIAPGVSGCSIVNPRFSGPTPKVIDAQSENVLILDVAHSVKSHMTSKLLKTQALYAEGISASEKAARNLRGQASISGDEKTVRARFPTPEPDDEYFVTATVVSVKGNAPPGARSVHIAEKAGDGFKICLQEAPGRGNAVTVNWILVR